MKYSLELTEKQVRLLSFVCDRYARLICGQGFIFQELMEQAWVKRCKTATGKPMDESFEGGWYAMREDAEKLVKEMKKRFWGLRTNEDKGVHYDDTADILIDIHEVIRHQLWKDNPNRASFTVDAYPASQWGKETLATIHNVSDND